MESRPDTMEVAMFYGGPNPDWDRPDKNRHTPVLHIESVASTSFVAKLY